MWIFSLLVVAFFFVVGLLRTQTFQGAVFMAAWPAVLGLIAGYFQSRSSKPASKTERVLARTWLFVRRTVCFVGAACIGGTGTVMLIVSIGKRDGYTVLASCFSLLLSGIFVWWGIYGTGRARGISDDRPVHEERRKRYGWK